ncbi:hypothetical protein BSFA1_42550 [Burkholderia sp. SFA1]|nr:hypothetical protein BSFA1_42550 [Burkholderia sp. SFA1]
MDKMPNSVNEGIALETYKSLISISVEVFKYLALLNGGAAAAVLAGFDRLVKNIPLGALQIAVISFVVGLLLCGLAMFCAYWTQISLFNEYMGRMRRIHGSILLAAALCSALSLIAFAVGAMVSALSAHATST